MTNPLANDLDHILAHTRAVWEELRSTRIFITGGTGFFGCWLLESFLWANEKLHLGSSATVLSRNLETFQSKAPHLARHPAITLHEGDVRTFAFPEGEFTHVIHAATEASVKLNAEAPLLMLDTIVEGTRRTLDFAVACKAKKFLLTSSGAVYGKQPSDLTHISEEYSGAPDPLDTGAAYGHGKRLAEHLCALYSRQHPLETKIARCFAFVGPYLPLDTSFAIGNFIRDAMGGKTIHVNGDGTPFRSYLYAADLAVWLWTILIKGIPERVYNVGSDRDLSIAEVATTVQKALGCSLGSVFASNPKPAQPISRYVPNASRAKNELGLDEYIFLPDAIRRTAAWHSHRQVLEKNI